MNGLFAYGPLGYLDIYIKKNSSLRIDISATSPVCAGGNLYTAELLINMFATLFWPFVLDAWNWFDLLVVGVSLVSLVSVCVCVCVERERERERER
jgi:hypothetical protein